MQKKALCKYIKWWGSIKYNPSLVFVHGLDHIQGKITMEWQNAWTRSFIKNNEICQKELVHRGPCHRRPYPWTIKLYIVNSIRNSPRVLHKQNTTPRLIRGRNFIHFIPHTPFSSLTTNITHDGDRSQISRPTSNSLKKEQVPSTKNKF